MSELLPFDQVCPQKDAQCIQDQACTMALNEGRMELMCEPIEVEDKDKVHASAVGAFFTDAKAANVLLQYVSVGVTFPGETVSGAIELLAPVLDSSAKKPFKGINWLGVRQANISYAGFENIDVTLGVQDTHFGYELNDASLNPFVSNSWVYNVGPVDVTELSIAGAFSEAVAWKLGLNGSNYAAYPLNPYPALYGGLVFATGDAALYVNVGAGPENADSRNTNASDIRVLLDLVGTYNPSDQVNLAVNIDEGYDYAGGANAHWRAGAAYAIYKPTDRFTIPLRGDFLQDGQGFISGAPNAVASAGVTGGIHYATKIAKIAGKHQIGAELNSQWGLNRYTDGSVVFGMRYAWSASQKM